MFVNWGTKVHIEGITVRRNNAKDGGGIFIGGLGLNGSLVRITVEENQAEKYGGIHLPVSEHLGGEDLLKYIETLISNNQAKIENNKPEDFGVNLSELRMEVERSKIREETRLKMMLVLGSMLAIIVAIGKCTGKC